MKLLLKKSSLSSFVLVTNMLFFTDGDEELVMFQVLWDKTSYPECISLLILDSVQDRNDIDHTGWAVLREI